MYVLTFNMTTMKDAWAYYRSGAGRQLFGAIVVPDSGLFTPRGNSSVNVPKIVCPYQVNDILAIQERWARSDDTYVYATDSEGYTFRPATTMPVSAARMFARIVSIRTWPVTTDIIDNYLTIGNLADGYAGTGKVIDYYDTGNRLLSSIRKPRNQEVLNKSSQPSVSSTPPMANSHPYYYLKEKVTYSYHSSRGSYTTPETTIAIVKETKHTKDGNILGYKDYDRNVNEYAWEYSESTYDDLTEPKIPDPLDPTKIIDNPRYNANLEYVGEADWSNPEEGWPCYYYYRLDKNGHRIPLYASFETKIVDPSRRLYCWLISAYLCYKDGTIMGRWF